MLNHNLPPPPQNTKYVERQAGGHCASNGDDLFPNLQHVDGTFLKLIRDSPRYVRELLFYQKVFQDDRDSDEDIVQLRKLLPNFYGIFIASIAGKEIKYLKLEDLTRKYKLPCLLDIKMKANIHDPNSNNTHEVFEIADRVGFLLDGLQVYDHQTHQYISYQKKFGKGLDEEGVDRALRLYLNGSGEHSKLLVKSFLRRLRQIRNWATTQRRFTFYRSSLLFVYDAAYFENGYSSSPQDCLQKNGKTQTLDELTDIRLLDFPKVYESKENDVEYCEALDNLIRYFNVLLY